MRINRELGRTPERLYMRAVAVAFWLIVWELGRTYCSRRPCACLTYSLV